MTNIFKFFIRISAFLSKELVEVLRQPRLILTLVLGPFLIISLFGWASPEHGRKLRTTFVVNNPEAFTQEIESFTESFQTIIASHETVSDQEEALRKLAANQTDMVIIVPDEPLENLEENQRTEFMVYHNEIDPFQASYITTVAREFTDEINSEFLETTIEGEQGDLSGVQTDLETAISQTQRIRQLTPSNEVAELEQGLTEMHGKLTQFRTITSGTLVAPFTANVEGLSELDFTITMFFAPAVIALMLQHFSITFASLSIVRESFLGIMELFRVSPITAFETLFGKYLSYFLFEVILAAIVTVFATWLLDIPILGNMQEYALVVAVLLFASLGMGFFISLISQNDTQAVQFSMLLLLASIFFSGFLLDLRLMKEPVTYLSWLLPATYGVRMLQDVMLRGTEPSQFAFWGITFMGVILFLINWILLRRKIGS